MVFIDLARAIAAIFMLYGHALDALLAPEYRTGAWHDAWQFQRGLTSYLFLLLSGFAFSIATARHWPAQLTLSPALGRRARRFGLFLLLGYALHLPMAPARAMLDAPPETWRAFFAVDVLQVIGVTFIGVQLLVFVLRRRAAVTLAALLLAVIVPLATPFAWQVDWTAPLPDLLAAYLSPATGSLFPLLPWSAFILLGIALGQLYAVWGASHLGGFANRALLLPGLVLVLVWLALTASVGTHVGDGPFNYVPGQVLLRAGVCLLILSAVAHISPYLGRLPHLVGALAQETLVVYVVHVCIVYGSLWNPGLARWFGGRLTPLPMLVVIVLLIVSMTALASWWNRWKHMHPRRVRAVVLAIGALMLLRLL